MDVRIIRHELTRHFRAPITALILVSILSAVPHPAFSTDTGTCANPVPLGTLCQQLSNLPVCQNKYDPNSYVCADFAADLYTQANAKGWPTWQMVYNICTSQILLYNNPPMNCTHGLNIVQVAYPNSTVMVKYCLVTGQGGGIIYGCWLQAPGPPVVPSWITQKMVNSIPCIAQAQAQGWCFQWNVVASPPAP